MCLIFIIVVHAPTEESTEKEIGKFYCIIGDAKIQCKSQGITIIMGDLNVKSGKERDEEILTRNL